MQDIKVFKSKNGYGVFLDKNTKKGDVILYFEGKTLDYDEIEINSYEDSHCIQIGERVYLGPSGNADDFMNHSCNPNCGIKNIAGELAIVAIKNSKKHEELTFDYSTSELDTDWKMKCNCGSKNCRGIIRGFGHLPKHLQKKYIRLGIVPKFILKKCCNKNI